MNFIKKHKMTTFIILVYIVLIGFGFFLYNMFIGSSGMPVYGDRLDGIDKVPITEEQKTKIVDAISKESNVKSVSSLTLSGKIVKVIITLDDNANREEAKKLANKVTENMTEEQNKFYDVQVFLNKEYNCTLTATGILDEDGNFSGDVTVKFKNDLSQNTNVSTFGISDKETVEYNSEQEYKVTKDGTYVVYGFVKDKNSELKCSIKIVRKSSDVASEEETIESSTDNNFPIIGYKRKATDTFVWTKDR